MLIRQHLLVPRIAEWSPGSVQWSQACRCWFDPRNASFVSNKEIVQGAMVYRANVLPVMIASPGDVADERRLAGEVINAWNASHSIATSLILNAVSWDQAPADLGGRAQQLINDRLLKDCDLLVGIFWSRLGTPTGEFESGTVEEIRTHREAGKPAMVYFSDRPIPPSRLDAGQYKGVRGFKDWCQTEGIIRTYNTPEEFRTHFSNDLQTQINTNSYLINIKNSPSAALTYPPAVLTTPALETPSISSDAIELLHEAASDRTGRIGISNAINRQSIGTNQKEFGTEDARSFANWNAALEELVAAKLVERVNDQIFAVTDRGYKTAQ
jgi:hypothetical protein